MTVIHRKDVIEAYKEVDLYRTKYRHDDLSVFGWCFHGNQSQGWVGQARDRRLHTNGSTVKEFKRLEVSRCVIGYTSNKTGPIDNPTIDGVDALTHRYTSTTFVFPGIKDSVSDYGIEMNYYTDTDLVTTRIDRIYPGENIIFHNMEGVETWTSNIVKWEVKLKRIKSEQFNSPEDYQVEWEDSPIDVPIVFEYFKIDSEDVYYEAIDDETITEMDVNYLREQMDLFNKGKKIDWAKPGPIDDRVKKFLDVIKKVDIKIKDKIRVIEPYNGCAECDSYTCACYATRYGWVGCSTCDSCNQYNPCNRCDRGCFSEATSCTCNARCYSQSVCTCEGCHSYSCTCDSVRHTCPCQGPADRCTQCYGTTYTPPCNNTPPPPCGCYYPYNQPEPAPCSCYGGEVCNNCDSYSPPPRCSGCDTYTPPKCSGCDSYSPPKCSGCDTYVAPPKCSGCDTYVAPPPCSCDNNTCQMCFFVKDNT